MPEPPGADDGEDGERPQDLPPVPERGADVALGQRGDADHGDRDE